MKDRTEKYLEYKNHVKLYAHVEIITYRYVPRILLCLNSYKKVRQRPSALHFNTDCNEQEFSLKP